MKTQIIVRPCTKLDNQSTEIDCDIDKMKIRRIYGTRLWRWEDEIPESFLWPGTTCHNLLNQIVTLRKENFEYKELVMAWLYIWQSIYATRLWRWEEDNSKWLVWPGTKPNEINLRCDCDVAKMKILVLVMTLHETWQSIYRTRLSRWENENSK